MKRILLYLCVLIIGVTITSCNLNEIAKFDDKDAFVAFNSISLSVNENGKTISIPVTLTSLNSMSTTVTFDFEDGTAKEGVDFSVSGSKTLNFTSNSVQNIVINISDQFVGEFTGDKSFRIVLTGAGSLNLGANAACTVRILDTDHPLTFILGSYSTISTSYWNGETVWSQAVEKDASNVDMVWFTNFVPGGTTSTIRVYGIVNAEKTEIRIPVGQELVSNGAAFLRGWYWDVTEDWDVSIPDNGFIIFSIEEGGKKLTCKDMYGSNLAGGSQWYNIVYYTTMNKD